MKNISITGIFVKTYMTISLVWAKADTTYNKVKATVAHNSVPATKTPALR